MGRVKVLAVVLVISLLVLQAVDGRSLPNSDVYELERPAQMPSKKPVKTIYSEDGDVIDCIHIYAQPAFDHPLLNDHKIQLRPTSHPKDAPSARRVEYQATWRKSGGCPEGTVPILRPHSPDAPSIISPLPLHPESAANKPTTPGNHNPVIEWAALKAVYGKDYGVFGAYAQINVWSPQVFGYNDATYSIVALYIEPANTESIITGWMASLFYHGDNQTRLFVNYHNSQGTSCGDLRCPGFVQVTPYVVLGEVLPSSTVSGTMAVFETVVFKDQSTGNWFVKFNGEILGYYPNNVFQYMNFWANTTFYGGVVYDTYPNGLHTQTQMGSGFLPTDDKYYDYGRASYTMQIKYINGDGDTKELLGSEFIITNPDCYNMTNINGYLAQDKAITNDFDEGWGNYIFFGGSGLSDHCA